MGVFMASGDSSAGCAPSAPHRALQTDECGAQAAALAAPTPAAPTAPTYRPPPKKKWIKEYLEEEPAPAVSVLVSPALTLPPRTNGLLLTAGPAPSADLTAPLTPPGQHSRPSTNSHGRSVPSPPGGRAGTREVHNKLEKNRRAHLKECFELLKRQLPATSDDKKASNLAILGSANRYIQVLRRKERECEHEMERLAREKIAAQQRLAALRRELALRPRSAESPGGGGGGGAGEDGARDRADRAEPLNGTLLTIPISITSSTCGVGVSGGGVGSGVSVPAGGAATSSLHVPLHLAHAAGTALRQNGLGPCVGGAASGAAGGAASGAALVHPAQIHLPLSQMVRGGLVVGGAALQLVGGAGLRLLHPQAIAHNGVLGARDLRGGESGATVAITSAATTTPTPPESGAAVVVSGLAPLVVSSATGRLLAARHPVSKVLESQTLSAQYVGAALVKPLVVVSAPPAPPAAPPPPASTRT